MGEPISTGMAISLALGTAAVGAGATAISAHMQGRAADKAREAEEEARKVDLAMQNEQAARDRRAQIREARVQRAMVQNTAAVTGQTGGSAVIVGGQAATQQAGVNIGNINTAQSFARAQSKAQQNVVNAQAKGAGVGAQLLGAVGGQLMSIGLQKGTESIFKK